MIHKHEGDLLAIEKGIIVHGCNSHGVMGGGIAAQVRKIWPAVYEAYKRECDLKKPETGEVIFVSLATGVMVANAITQKDFGADPNVIYVDYDGLEKCFEKIAGVAQILQLPIHFPLIGCGLANGDWDVVSEIIDRVVPDDVEKHLWVFPEQPVTLNN